MSTVTAPATSSGLEDMGNWWGEESGICPICRREQIRVWVNRLQKNQKKQSILILEMTHKPSFAFIITLLPRHSMSHTSPLCHSGFGCQRFFYPIGVGNMSHVVHLHITLGCVAIPFRTTLCCKPLRTCSLVLATRPPPPSHTTTCTPLVSVLIRRLMSSGSPVFRGPTFPSLMTTLLISVIHYLAALRPNPRPTFSRCHPIGRSSAWYIHSAVPHLTQPLVADRHTRFVCPLYPARPHEINPS